MFYRFGESLGNISGRRWRLWSLDQLRAELSTPAICRSPFVRRHGAPLVSVVTYLFASSAAAAAEYLLHGPPARARPSVVIIQRLRGGEEDWSNEAAGWASERIECARE